MTYTVFLIIYGIVTHLIAEHFGRKRFIGYGKSIFWSILLTPLIGIFITLASKPLPSNQVN